LEKLEKLKEASVDLAAEIRKGEYPAFHENKFSTA
jgi:hypothetical protein